MSSNMYDSNKGCNIRPSARVSIHQNCDNSRCRETMKKYGPANKGWKPATAQGVDDVDNVMSHSSKLLRPILAQPQIKYRRRSFNTSDDTPDDDGDENSFSKSSPPSLASSSVACVSASEESILEECAQDPIPIPSGSQSTSSNRFISSRHVPEDDTLHTGPLQKTATKSNNYCRKLIYILLPILFGGFSVIVVNYNNPRSNESQENYVYDKYSFYNDINVIGEKYNIQHTSILKVKTGISSIFEKRDTGSFIFTYDSDANNFNPLKLDQFVEDISTKSSKYLRNETEQVHHVVVNLSHQIMHTDKEFMKQYQSDVNQRGVMLVKDVDNIPSHLAMAFHYYCDEYNPLVKKSAIFFTLNLAKCSNGSNRKSTHAYVEKCLAKKWKYIEQDKIGPLLTRVVNVVVDVTNM